MSAAFRKLVLRADGAFLAVVGAVSMVLDLRAAFSGVGPQSAVIRDAPHSAIGFVEAHGLAVILGVLFLRAAPSRSWHFTGAAVHALLGASNVVFWQTFVVGEMLAVGYVTTGIHVLLVILQLAAAAAARREPARSF